MTTEFDLNCKTCAYFKKEPRQGSNQYRKYYCSENGQDAFDDICYRWKPDLDIISDKLKAIKENLSELSFAELQTIPHLLDNRLQNLKDSVLPHHQVGRYGIYHYKDREYRLKIQNVSEEMIFGVKSTDNGFRRFRVLPDVIKKF